MSNSPAESRELTIRQLQAARADISIRTAFLGLDGFVDEITRVVDTRRDSGSFESIQTIADLGRRISNASGKSTNMELVVERTKIGGNGPIMANALCQLGVKVTYVGALRLERPHRVFEDLCGRAEVHSIADPGHSDALEFNDGKIILGKLQPLLDVNWANIQRRYSREGFIRHFNTAGLVGLVNWTMIPFMSDIYEALLKEVCPALTGPRRPIFFDLADPQKRTPGDIIRALDLIRQFQSWFDVVLGLNEKEAYEVARVLGLPAREDDRDALISMSTAMQKQLGIGTVVVHPVRYAFAVSGGSVALAEGPRVARPRITTGAGDHFNAGFCFGKLLGLENSLAVLTGVSTSGFYVREARSPGIDDLIGLLQDWPASA